MFAPHGCLVLLVAGDAPLHLERLLKAHDFLRCDVAITTRTLDLRGRMRAVAEEDKARHSWKICEGIFLSDRST